MQLFTKISPCEKHNRWMLNGVCSDCRAEERTNTPDSSMIAAGQKALEQHLIGLVKGIDYSSVVAAIYNAMERSRQNDRQT